MKMLAPDRRTASALLLALWALLLLSAAVLAWVQFLDRQIGFGERSNQGLDARAAAFSGLSVALHRQVTPRSPLLKKTLGPNRSYEVVMRGEGGKLNVNWLLAGEDPQKLQLLKNYLARRGLGFRDIEVLVDSLLDWVDADNVKRLNGMEQGPNYLAPNRPLESVDEIRQVAGADAFVSLPNWDADLTTFSQGPVDLMAADQDVLAIIPGIGDAGAERFLQYRRGGDGIDNTEDDPVIENMTAIRSFLGFSENQFRAIARLVTFNDPTWKIESKGTAAKVDRQLDVVARKVGNGAQILSWKEF